YPQGAHGSARSPQPPGSPRTSPPGGPGTSCMLVSAYTLRSARPSIGAEPDGLRVEVAPREPFVPAFTLDEVRPGVVRVSRSIVVAAWKRVADGRSCPYPGPSCGSASGSASASPARVCDAAPSGTCRT